MRRRGLTLLETLVALGITALVLAALQGAVLRAASARSRATAAADRIAAGRTLLLRLGAEVEAVVPAGDDGRGPFVLGRAVQAGFPWSFLRLTTVARDAVPGAAPASDRRVVAYQIEPDVEPGADGSPGGVLVRREQVRPDPPGAAAPPAVPVMRGVRGFRVRALDDGVWSEAWADGTRLPRAVELMLGLDDGAGGVTELATTVALPLGGR